MNRPEPNEYNEYYAGYVALVTETDVIDALENQIDEIKDLIKQIPEEKGSFAYEEGKWSIKQVIGHLIDTERVFSYRALRFSKGDTTVLPGYDQDLFVEKGGFNDTSLHDLRKQLTSLRKANVIFFKNLSEGADLMKGNANGNEVSVRALAYMMVGHVRHHLNIVRERYL
jgi:Mg2+ and Co2+ transporter CorA